MWRYAALAVLTLALAMRDNVTALRTLLSPSFVLFAAWLCFTVVLSFDPATSIRRFSLTACVFAVAASLPLLAKSQHELMRWFSIAALTLLAICYLGILLAPHLSIHLATDPQEPGLAGNWRGSFGHKNMAAGIMAMLLFFGIYFVRAGAWIAGVSVIGLASLFLIYSAGKSSLTLCFAVLLLTSLTSVVRSFGARVVMMLMPLAAFEHAQHRHRDERYACPNCKPVAAGRELYRPYRHLELCAAVAAAAIGDRLRLCLVLGQQRHPELAGRQGVGGFAAHSHNGYLDTALGMGLPGLALLIAAIVVKPLRDFQAADQGGNDGPLAMVFLRIWLFGLYLSSMESFFLDRADPMWVTFLIAVFGLHYLARFRARAT